MVTKPYRILAWQGGLGLLCLARNRVSWRETDVREHYCSACHVAFDDLPELLRLGGREALEPVPVLGGRTVAETFQPVHIIHVPEGPL